MKQWLYIFLVTSTAISFCFKNDTEQIIAALTNKNLEEVIQYFNEHIDLKLPANDELKNIEKLQAANAFKNFFQKNKINIVEVTHQRQVGNAHYITGKLISNNINFGFTIITQQQLGKEQISSIRIN